MFTKPIYTATALHNLLAQHPNHLWLLDKWEHWALLSAEVRDREKEIVFHRWAWEHPKCTVLPPKRPLVIPTPEQYLEILADREQKQLRIEHAKKEERLQAERAVEEKRLQVQRLSERVLTQEEIQGIFSAKDPAELLALASNSHLPILWIQKLINCHNVKGARQIREAAQENLRAQLS